MNPIIPQNRYVITLTQLGELSPRAFALVRLFRRPTGCDRALLSLPTFLCRLDRLVESAETRSAFAHRRAAQKEILRSLSEWLHHPGPTYIEV
jgi:hypothetical protein